MEHYFSILKNGEYMSLLKKVDWFYKLAQEMGSDMPMHLRETGIGGIAGKSMPSKGYPYQSIRELASRLLRRLQSHPSVPRTVKDGASSFGDLLSDFNNNTRWFMTYNIFFNPITSSYVHIIFRCSFDKHN